MKSSELKNVFVPELLIPAGNLEKLKVACLYGADAVYLAGQKFGLRTAADNFTLNELQEGVSFAHERGVKVYVVLNSFLHTKDFDGLDDFIADLSELNVDAVIVSDLGVALKIKQKSNIPLHVSTQASVVNAEAALFWKNIGASRVVVGREISIEETAKIKSSAQMEVEMFVHGSMCMAYSGRCVISNFTQGRDSNRGGCAHSCRFEYSLDFNNEEQIKAYFMSSKDLNGIGLIEDFSKHQIDSLKIEGRMKSPLYVATMSKVYREALDYYKVEGNFKTPQIKVWEEELNKVPHRDYTTANLSERASDDSIFNEREHSDKDQYQIAATVIEITKTSLILEVKNAFEIGNKLEFLCFKGPVIHYIVSEMTDMNYASLQRTRPSMLIRLPLINGVEKLMIVRVAKK